MFLIIDLAIILIIAICLGVGYKRGLTGSLVKILSFIIALAIALVIFKPISNFIIDNTKADETIQQSIVEVFIKNEEKENENSEEQTSVAEPIISYINEQVEDRTNEAKMVVVNSAARSVAITIINIGVVIILFIISRIALIFVNILTKLITKLPVIKQADKLGGILFGLLQSLVIICIGLSIISFVSPLINNYTIANMIGQSYIGSVLYNNNLLLKIIF